jgi:hypothetical protein
VTDGSQWNQQYRIGTVFSATPQHFRAIMFQRLTLTVLCGYAMKALGKAADLIIADAPL